MNSNAIVAEILNLLWKSSFYIVVAWYTWGIGSRTPPSLSSSYTQLPAHSSPAVGPVELRKSQPPAYTDFAC